MEAIRVMLSSVSTLEFEPDAVYLNADTIRVPLDAASQS
jgi:hypothetical protein